jgi:pimeloyl-ACP methyl ester carboxylesterase
MTSPDPGRARRLLQVIGAGAAVLALIVLLPSTRAGLKAPGVLAESLERSWPRPLARDVERRPATVGGVAGERYEAAGRAPPVLFVPGATPAGLSDRRTVRAATALARAGRSVFVPELALYERSLETRDITRVAEAAAALASQAPDGQVVMVGFSFGGSMALLAAAEEILEDRIAVLGVFGAYWDLEGYAQAAATGVSLVDGREVPWRADPQAPDTFRKQVVGLAAEAEQDALIAALDGEEDPAGLPRGARALHDLITHDDPARTSELFARLPTDVAERLRRLSPASVTDRITAPVIALHDRDDPAVPYGEVLRLRNDLPHARVLTVELFEHVDLDTERSWREVFGDLVDTWRFTRAVLAPQERVWPW